MATRDTRQALVLVFNGSELQFVTFISMELNVRCRVDYLEEGVESGLLVLIFLRVCALRSRLSEAQLYQVGITCSYAVKSSIMYYISEIEHEISFTLGTSIFCQDEFLPLSSMNPGKCIFG